MINIIILSSSPSSLFMLFFAFLIKRNLKKSSLVHFLALVSVDKKSHIMKIGYLLITRKIKRKSYLLLGCFRCLLLLLLLLLCYSLWRLLLLMLSGSLRRLLLLLLLLLCRSLRRLLLLSESLGSLLLLLLLSGSLGRLLLI